MRARVKRFLRAMTPPSRRGALVLLYHRAAALDRDPWRLAVSPTHLGEHLQILARHARPMNAGGLQQALAGGRLPARTVVVTFDDGYADLATQVRPRLEQVGVPATMFLVSRAIGRDREFWWDALERALLAPGTPEAPETPEAPLSLAVNGRTRTWDVAGAASREALHREVWSALRGLAPNERDRLAEATLAWAGMPARPRATHRTLTHSELASLAGDELVEIGAHTANHAWLAGLTPTDQSCEIDGGRAELEAMVGQRIETFAYPHGGRDDIGGAADAVRRAGFGGAFLATGGLVGRRTDPHALPRLFVEDMDGEGFAAMLRRYAGIQVS